MSNAGFLNYEEEKFGESGGQIDVFFNIPKESFLGGRYGTKIALNYSAWYELQGEKNLQNQTYIIAKEFGDKLFQDTNIEIKKKME